LSFIDFERCGIVVTEAIRTIRQTLNLIENSGYRRLLSMLANDIIRQQTTTIAKRAGVINENQKSPD
jgi:hypothetical protein